MHGKTLKEHFPLIRDREEVLADIYGKEPRVILLIY